MALPVRRREHTSSGLPSGWEPFRELDELQQRTADLMQSLWSGARPGEDGPCVPSVDIEETDDAWILEAEVPGVPREDVDVEVTDSEVVISGEIKEREPRGILRRRTRRTGRFEYRVTLPGQADPESVEATLNDGVLTVRVPKSEVARAEARRGPGASRVSAVAPVWRSARPAPGRPDRRPPRELDLVVAAQRDPLARARLLDTFRPLIASVARTYARSTSVERTELMQEGVVGLLRALERYDPDLGTPFWAYAGWWVRQAMQQLVTELMRPVVLSDRAVRQLARIKTARSRFAQAHAREPSVGDLAVSTGLSREQIGLLVAAERRPRALEEPIDGEDGGRASFGEMLADPSAEDPYESVAWRAHLEELPRLLEALTDRERAIVCGHYGLGGAPQTLRELAASLGVSAERVRQIEHGALDKLRAAAGV